MRLCSPEWRMFSISFSLVFTNFFIIAFVNFLRSYFMVFSIMYIITVWKIFYFTKKILQKKFFPRRWFLTHESILSTISANIWMNSNTNNRLCVCVIFNVILFKRWCRILKWQHDDSSISFEIRYLSLIETRCVLHTNEEKMNTFTKPVEMAENKKISSEYRTKMSHFAWTGMRH